MKYKAYYNSHLIGETKSRNYGVEIYTIGIDGEYLETVEYRFFDTQSQAIQHAKQFNQVQNLGG